MLSLIWLIFTVIISIVVHELGHACAARRCGFRVDAIRFGLGNTIRKWRWYYTEISIGLPASAAAGIVEYSDRGRGSIPQKLFVAVSGVLANAVLMILASLGGKYLNDWDNYWATLGITNMLLVAVNLIPFPISRRGSYAKFWSDGGQIAGLIQQHFTGRNFTG